MNYVKENKKIFDYLNIPYWHSLGYTGKGIKYGHFETAVNPNLEIYKSRVHDPFNLGTDKQENHHANNTLDYLLQIAPDIDTYLLSTAGNYGFNGMSGQVADTFNFIEDNKIDLIGASKGGTANSDFAKRLLECKSKGSVFLTSAGNTYGKGVTGYASTEVWINVSAVRFVNDEEIDITHYSAQGDEVDTSSFGNVYVRDIRRGYEGRIYMVTGTSFARPAVTGMLAIFNQYVKEQIGRTLYKDEAMLFIIDNVEDLGDEGHDAKFGHGLFKLPSDINKVDLNKYLLHGVEKDIPFNPTNPKEDEQNEQNEQNKNYNTELKLTTNNKTMILNGIKKEMDVAPFVQNDRMFVPIRFVAESFDIDIEWNQEKRQATFRK